MAGFIRKNKIKSNLDALAYEVNYLMEHGYSMDTIIVKLNLSESEIEYLAMIFQPELMFGLA